MLGTTLALPRSRRYRHAVSRRPRGTARLVGREQELAAVSRALFEHRLVTLWGPPGVGKTRLASELIAREALAEGEALPTAFLDLAAASTAPRVAAVVAEGLGLELGTGTASVDELGRLLAERGPQLLILDNFEQATALASDALAGWLEQAPDTSWLVTSRQRLGIADECVIEVLPLGQAAAVELFADRARAVVRDFELTADVAPHVERLVSALDCLPLAIELCACRSGILSPEQLVRELSRGHELLEPPARASIGSLRGLSDAIGSSWAALSAAERATLEQCCVFAGGFDLEDAAEVVDLSEHGGRASVFDTLQTLVDRSLLAAVEPSGSGPRRFRVLLCIREYLRARLGFLEQTQRRHAAHFLKLGRTWSELAVAQQDPEARRGLVRAREELWAIYERALRREAGLSVVFAVEAALTLVPWYRRFGPYSALLEMLDRALVATESSELDPAVLCKAIGARASTLRQLGRLEEAGRELDRAIDIGRERKLGLLVTLLESEAAQTELESEGDLARARELQERVLTSYREHNQRVLEGHALLALGNMHYVAEDLAEAQRSVERALAVQREVGDHVYECEALRWLGVIELALGLKRSAREHFQQALEAIERVDERRWRPASLADFGRLEQEDGNHRRAIALFSEATFEARWLGQRRIEGVARGRLGTCLLEQGALHEARSALVRAVDDLGGFARLPERALFRACIGVLDAMQDQQDSAARQFALAEEDLGRTPQRLSLRRALDIHRGHLELGRARAASQAGERELAEDLTSQARRRLGSPPITHPEVCFAERLLNGALGGGLAARHNPPWRIHETSLWFEPPYAARVELGRKHALRRLLTHLTRAYAAKSSAPVPASELIAAGWPGEKIQKRAAANRLRVALFSLRRLGLQDLIVTKPDGYQLEPSASVEVSRLAEDSAD